MSVRLLKLHFISFFSSEELACTSVSTTSCSMFPCLTYILGTYVYPPVRWHLFSQHRMTLFGSFVVITTVSLAFIEHASVFRMLTLILWTNPFNLALTFSTPICLSYPKYLNTPHNGLTSAHSSPGWLLIPRLCYLSSYRAKLYERDKPTRYITMQRVQNQQY